MKKHLSYLIIAIFCCLFFAGCASSQTTGDLSSDLVITIENKGSDTIVNLALAWAEKYQEIKPDVQISVTGGGSGTGIAALINGTVDIANASRPMKNEEKQAAGDNGSDPFETVIARDAIAVIVNPSNPVNELTMQQISAIYSGEINNWKEVGGEDLSIVRLSRETNSGTHVYFLEEVIRLGESGNQTLFSRDTLLLPSSEGIGAEIRENPHTIGYDGLGYVTEDMKIIAVAKDSQSPYIIPSAETVNSAEYPIARDLYMYTDGKPGGPVGDYLDWILGSEAQNIVTELGFVPIQSENSPDHE